MPVAELEVAVSHGTIVEGQPEKNLIADDPHTTATYTPEREVNNPTFERLGHHGE
jgi:hypothetical protein